MRYFLTVIFFGFLLSNMYILHMNKNAVIKRKAFRWWTTVFAAFLVVYLSIALTDKVLLLVVLPVVAGVVFALLKFTKFCDWCGRMVQTNLPFGERNRCPRCGSNIS